MLFFVHDLSLCFHLIIIFGFMFHLQKKRRTNNELITKRMQSIMLTILEYVYIRKLSFYI